jgi:hypothetical protein
MNCRDREVRNAYGENCKTPQSRYKLFHLKHKNYRVLMGKPEGKRPLGRPRRRCEDGIRMDLRDWLGECRLDPVGSG